MAVERVYKAFEVLEFLQANAGKIVNAETIAKATGARHHTVPTMITRFMETHPELERVHKGQYRWNAVPVAPAEEQKPVERVMLVSVLSERDNRALVRDSDTGNLYTLSPFEF